MLFSILHSILFKNDKRLSVITCKLLLGIPADIAILTFSGILISFRKDLSVNKQLSNLPFNLYLPKTKENISRMRHYTFRSLVLSCAAVFAYHQFH